MLKTLRWYFMGLCMAFGTAHAALLQVDAGGELTGATGVVVGGATYDVTFVEGTCISVFTGCNEPADFPFGTDGLTALHAAQALLDQVFIDGPAGPFDTQPARTFGCEGEGVCAALTPFGSVAHDSDAVALNIFLESADTVLLQNDFTGDTAGDAEAVWARWSPAVQAVPEPSAFACLGVGLLALAWARRRRTLPGCRTQ